MWTSFICHRYDLLNCQQGGTWELLVPLSYECIVRTGIWEHIKQGDKWMFACQYGASPFFSSFLLPPSPVSVVSLWPPSDGSLWAAGRTKRFPIHFISTFQLVVQSRFLAFYYYRFILPHRVAYVFSQVACIVLSKLQTSSFQCINLSKYKMEGGHENKGGKSSNGLPFL